MNDIAYNRFWKILTFTMLLVITITCFAGCRNTTAKRVKDKDDKYKTSELYRAVTKWKEDDITIDDLGSEIIIDGDFNEVDPDNMLKFKGWYKGYDFVTLVFDRSSKIEQKNVELFASEEPILSYNGHLEGVLYQEKAGLKYLTFKFNTTILSYADGVDRQADTAAGYNFFTLPTKAGEPMSYYQIFISREREEHAMGEMINISECKQTQELDRSYYMDYRYDSKIQRYEDGQWSDIEQYKDNETDNMPLE